MKEPRIADLLTPVLAQLDLDLEAVDLIPAGKRKLLRIVVDGDGANGHGPNLDEIAEATKAISVTLDEEDVTGTSPYTLEVSSRGIGRPLELPRHWRRNVARLVAVTTTDGEKVTGRIVSATDDAVVLDVDQTTRELGYADVSKAQIQVELNRASAELED
jgi:ribosome maturation factor RimP